MHNRCAISIATKRIKFCFLSETTAFSTQRDRNNHDRPTHPDAKGLPAPSEGLVVTHLLIVADQDRSREFYRRVIGAEVVRERDPVMLQLSNSWLIINAGGGPTDDKPDVIAAPPQSAHVLTSALNIRVADIATIYREWRARGADFLTEPKDHGSEIRCYLKDPDGHLIEVGQSTGILEH